MCLEATPTHPHLMFLIVGRLSNSRTVEYAYEWDMCGFLNTIGQQTLTSRCAKSENLPDFLHPPRCLLTELKARARCTRARLEENWWRRKSVAKRIGDEENRLWTESVKKSIGDEKSGQRNPDERPPSESFNNDSGQKLLQSESSIARTLVAYLQTKHTLYSL